MQSVIAGSIIQDKNKKALLALWLIDLFKKEALWIGNPFEQICIVAQWKALPQEMQALILSYAQVGVDT